MHAARGGMGASPLFRRLFSTRFTPPAPSWDPRELFPPHVEPVSDAAMARLEALSCLSLRREGGASSEYERARADVASVLSAAGQLAGLARGGEPFLLTRLRARPEDALEAAAEARWARLRADEVAEGGDAEGVLAHAAVREGPFFSAPRFVGGGEGAPSGGARKGASEFVSDEEDEEFR